MQETLEILDDFCRSPLKHSFGFLGWSTLNPKKLTWSMLNPKNLTWKETGNCCLREIELDWDWDWSELIRHS